MPITKNFDRYFTGNKGFRVRLECQRKKVYYLFAFLYKVGKITFLCLLLETGMSFSELGIEQRSRENSHFRESKLVDGDELVWLGLVH